MSFKLNITLLCLLIGACQLFAQETKEDIEKNALIYFQKEQFIEATPLYLRLLSLEPRNPNYNYRYGTCLLYNSNEKQDAFKYLNYSIQNNTEVENEAYYYLGKAYHLTYQFDKAIQNFELYKQKAGSRTISKLDVDRQIEMCRNGKSLIANISETVVLEKTKISKESFFRIYNLKDIGGELIVTEEFQNRQDKRNNHVPLIHFPANSNRIYYSSYGDNSDNKDIYVRTRLPDKSWSKEQSVFGKVNTKYNEDFPYMHPSGKYLYFSSEGHNSMGGYDVFRSAYDAETNSFGEPENMDISISSPDNDFLYIVDSLDRYAYFASQRESEGDKIHVYSVRVERFPIQMVILKGQFSSTLNPSQKALSFTVNNNSGELVGQFKTSPQGEYLINLPKGGRYEFIVHVGDKEQKHRQFIDLPYLKEFRPLKQAVTETEKDQAEIILFENLFDERFENEGAIIAEAIKLKSKMEVNKDQFDIDSLDHLREQRKVFDQIGLSSFTNLEIHDLIKTKAIDLNERQNNSKEVILKAHVILLEGNEKIKESLFKADSLIQLAKISDNSQRAERNAQLAQKEILNTKQTQEEMDNAKIVLSFLEEDFDKNELLLKDANKLNGEVEDMTLSDDKALIELLMQHQAFVSTELLKDTKLDARFEYLSQINEQLKAKEELKSRQKQLLTNQKALQAKVDELKKSYDEASKRKQESIGLELSKAENELSDLTNELRFIEKQINESKGLEGQKEFIVQLDNQKSTQENIDFEEVAKTNTELVDKYARLSEANNQFATNNTIDLSEEALSNLSEEFTENRNETDAIGNSTSTTASTKEPQIEMNEIELTAEGILAALDPNYLKEIQLLEQEVENGTKSKQELVKRKYKAFISVGDAKTIAIQEQKTNPKSKSLSQKVELLIELEKQLNTEILSLEQEIEEENRLAEEKSSQSNTPESKPSIPSDSSREERHEENILPSTPETALAEIDPRYTSDVEQLELEIENGTNSKEELVKRKYKALISVGDVKTILVQEQKSTKKSKSISQRIELLTKVEKQLNAEILSLEQAIEEENRLAQKSSGKSNATVEEGNTSHSRTNNSSTTSPSNESEETPDSDIYTLESVLAEADANYFDDLEKIKKDILKGSKTKQDLIRRKYRAIISIEGTRDEVNYQKENGNDSPALDQKIELLNQLEQHLQSAIEVLEDEISAGDEMKEESTVSLKDLVLESAHRGYKITINPLLANFHSGQDNYEELLYAQEVHLSRVSEALESKGRKNSEEIEILTAEKEKTIAFIAELKSAQGLEEYNFNKTYKQALRGVLLTQQELDLLTTEPQNLDEANIKAQVLENILLQLTRDIESTTNSLEIRHLNRVKQELVERRRNVSFEFGDVTQTNEKPEKVHLNKIQDELSIELSNEQKEEFKTLYGERNKLIEEAEDEPALVDNIKHQKKIELVENTIATKESEILEQSINSSTTFLNENLQQTSNSAAETTPSTLQAKQSKIEVEHLVEEAKKEKNPQEQRDILKSAQEKQNQAVKEVEEEQKDKKVSEAVNVILTNHSFKNINPEDAFNTKEDLLKNQNDIGLQILNSKDQINRINAILPSTKRKDKAKLVQDKEKLVTILKQLEDKHAKLDTRINFIEQQEIEDANKGIAKDALVNTLSYEDEVRIAQSNEYKDLIASNHKLNQSQFELSIKEAQLIGEQNELKQITLSSSGKEDITEREKLIIAKQLDKIDQTAGEIKALRQEVRTQQQEIHVKLADENQEKEKIENMIARDVAPIKEAPSLPTIATGLVLSNLKSNNYTDENPIPLDLVSPGGLVFRVQIGAFSKPVPNTTFTEFSPITGDVVRPGLIRYVAGFFNSRDHATEARNKIREMGYSDAFVVAYCDGERVPVYKAIELMNSGACIPEIDMAESPIITAEEAQNTGGVSFKKELDVFAYNKAPGAVEAEAAEAKMGLYFTVQIGVYNRPVSSGQLFDISPLITKRLANGQIRYSSGIFNTFAEAKPKQTSAIDRGIKDAFVTAYYQGERISVTEAHSLLSEKGADILELMNPTVSKRNVVVNQSTTPIVKEEKRKFLENRKTQSLLVSKTKYTSYPTQVLNRYNEDGGLYYYDSITKNIKSFLFTDTLTKTSFIDDFEVNEMYKYAYPVEDQDGIKRKDALLHSESNSIHLSVKIAAKDLNSDVLETILNAPLNKQMKTSSDVLTVNFYVIDTNENDRIVNQLQVLLAKLGATHISKYKHNLESK